MSLTTASVTTKAQQIVIGAQLIEAGNSTWQIRNLTGISFKEEKIDVGIPEPTFYESEPEGRLTIKPAVMCLIGGAVAGAFFNNAIFFGIGVVVAVFNVWDNKTAEKTAWQARKDDFLKRQAVWRLFKDNPPIIYSLMIETNSGSRPVFHSFDKDGISNAVKAIKDAMLKPVEHQVTYNINTIDLSGDTNINNIGSTIFEQNVREYK
jgi:hypothetical protein